MPPDILNRIVEEKWREIDLRKRELSSSDLEAMIAGVEPPRGFTRAIKAQIARREPAVIAEMKKASPSKGIIRPIFEPARIAASYEEAGATCLSVLTDVTFFAGRDENLSVAKQAASLPVLRKDFIVDPYQVYESRAIGADCILLIAGILSISALNTLFDLASALDMDVLVEVHDEEELEKALSVPAELVGINNRNLKTFEVDLATTHALAKRVPAGSVVVTESGIHRTEEVASMLESGIFAFLVGEAFMLEKEPGSKLRELFFQVPNENTSGSQKPPWSFP
jgi:indole-3-glycerol phosphate synthase